MQCSGRPGGTQSVAIRSVKTRAKQRLMSDGQWFGYHKLRQYLKSQGVPETDAWAIAVYKFPPLDGSEPEIFRDPQYARIAAGWKNGKYPVLKSISGK